MLRIRKKSEKVIRAYRLGEYHSIIENLKKEGKILDLKNGAFEVFSQEAVNSGSGHGQLAAAGDWIRIDSAGFPYPCTDEWFRSNMLPLKGDEYKQIPKDLLAWTVDCDMCEEIRFLMEHKGLILNETDVNHYFHAFLWGTWESASKNSVIVFYDITHDKDGNIIDAEYNFVEKKEFYSSYQILNT